MGGRLLSCPFLHSESFNPLGLMRTVVILACCLSVVPSTNLLNEFLGGTHRNQVACVVALENLQRAKVLVLDSIYPFRTYGQLDGLIQKKWLLEKHTA
jgi:hypothetical protein